MLNYLRGLRGASQFTDWYSAGPVRTWKRFSDQQWYRRINAPFWTAVLSTLLCSLLYLAHRSGTWHLPGLDDWERSSSNLRFRIRGPRKPVDNRIVIVALDDRTRRGTPETWQTRRGFASLIRKVQDSGPVAFGVDAFFSSPEINLSASTVLQVRAAREALHAETELTEAGETAAEALKLVDNETRGDLALASAAEASPALVLALLFYLDGDEVSPDRAEPPGLPQAQFGDLVYLRQPAGRSPPRASGAVLPLPSVGKAVTASGHVNVKHDEDGAVREAPLVIEQGHRFYQHLALRLASLGTGLETSYVAGDNFIGLGDRKIPLSPRGFALISYLGGNNTFPRVSALDVLLAPEGHPALKDKIVLIGYTDAARDKIMTPFDQQLVGVELHANLIHNILHDELLSKGSPWLAFAALLALGGFISLLQLRRIRQRGAWLLGTGSLASMVVYAIVAQVLFSSHNLQIDLVAPLIAALVITLTALTMSLATEGREKAQLRSAFGQYLQSTLVERILQDPQRLRLGGQRRELTVLFSDIRSFSRFSEKLEPEVLSDFLNEYLTPMTDLVMSDSGMLDKYIGDAVMAVYGAPIEFDDHAARACGTALAMMKALIPLNEAWSKRGLPEIKIGIGINTGDMSVGNMGSKSRFDYTVMGDAVNLAARLESLTKAYGIDILVGHATMKAASSEYVFREIDKVRVIGREAPAAVYELCGTKASSPLTTEEIAHFHAALAAYRAMDWAEASKLLLSFAEAHPEDGAARTLLTRIAVLEATPPGEDWDGIFEQASK